MKSLNEAIKTVKKNATAKFDETVEAHFNFKLDVTKADQTVRTTTTLPHGTGKETRVAVLSSKKVKDADMNLTKADINKIDSGDISPGSDFDVLVTEPKYMSELAKLGPILGPVGLMPNPKNGTITDDVEKAVKSFKSGKIELRNEPDAPIIHVVIGKASFDDKKLKENFMEVWNTIKSSKPAKAKPDWIKNCYLTSTMSGSVEVDVHKL